MTDSAHTVTHTVVVEDEFQFTLIELSRACRVEAHHLIALVDEGVLLPIDADGAAWRFDGSALRRARTALRLARDLDLNPAGVALVLDLLDEIERLRSRGG